MVIMSILAHQDDETFSAGGVLAKYGKDAFAVCVTSDPKRRVEFQQACKILGINQILMDNDHVGYDNEGLIREQLIKTIREKRPDHIITHVEFDYHGEHRMVRKIVEEAVEWASHTTDQRNAHQVKKLWGAETTVLIPSPHILIDITETNDKRMEAIRVYESQSHKGGEGFYSAFHSKRTELRGVQAGVSHAEAFLETPLHRVGSFKPLRVMKGFQA